MYCMNCVTVVQCVPCELCAICSLCELCSLCAVSTLCDCYTVWAVCNLFTVCTVFTVCSFYTVWLLYSVNYVQLVHCVYCVTPGGKCPCVLGRCHQECSPWETPLVAGTEQVTNTSSSGSDKLISSWPQHFQGPRDLAKYNPSVWILEKKKKKPVIDFGFNLGKFFH